MSERPPQDGPTADRDNDGLTNELESVVGTDPGNPDSDGDGIRDGVDPDVIASVILQLPEDAFKSEGEGHRTALLSLLDNNERHLLAGRIVQGIRLLEDLGLRMDGCPSVPDADDWIVDCETQRVLRGLLDALLANHASFAVDGDLQPPVAALPGLEGGPERPVGVALGPEGLPEPFVLNEVLFRPTDPGALDAFLEKYEGVVLHDGAPLLLPGAEPPAELPDAAGWYLIRVNPYRSSLEDLLANMERGGIRGRWSFSSEAAARLAALVAREWELGVSLNFTMELAQHSVPEHPDGAGGNLNAATWWWMTEDDDPNTPGDQGLSVGVIHAWEYVQYKGYPPVDVPYQPVRVAVIDTGFDLDETTGEPLCGEGDYPTNLLQLDEVDRDQTAGGAGYGAPGCNGCWHGQLTFGTCCALSQNGYGTAGTSGGWDIEPMVIKVVSSLDTVTRAVYGALYNGADVIHETLGFECGWWCRTFSGGSEFKSAVKAAKAVGAIFVTPAQNQGKDVSSSDLMPCNVDGAVCVGAIKKDGKAASYSNWGSIIDTWAPTDTLSAITRDSAAWDPDDVGSDELYLYTGTSAATPYLTGIVTLMKMVNPGITYDEVRGILVGTANSSVDAKVKDRGYVDAYRAVQAASPNHPPTVEILTPNYGDRETYPSVTFKARVTDPENPSPMGVGADFSTRVVFSSDRDGHLCNLSEDATHGGVVLGCEALDLSLGGHLITVTATDPFGAVATESVNFTVINTPATVKITHPADGSTYDTSQQVNLRGYAFDVDEGYLPLSWSSDLGGTLGTAGDFWVSLPEGDHTITLSATDEKGETATDTITVHVQAQPTGGGSPTVQISQPEDNKTFPLGTLFTFQGQATDPEDGTITADVAFRWSSSVDGFLGAGRTLQHTLSLSGEATLHEITLAVTDSDGHQGTHTIRVTVLRPQ